MFKYGFNGGEIRGFTEKQGIKKLMSILLQNLPELLRLNLLFILCSLPVITIPAAMTAAASVTTKMVREEVFFFKEDFFEVFKGHILKSLGLCAPAAVIFTGAFYLLPFYRAGLEISPVFYIPLVIVVLTVLMALFMGMYAFPMLTAVELSAVQVLRNSAILALLQLNKTGAAFAACLLLCLFTIITLPVSLLIIATCLFSLISLISSFCAWDGICKYVLKG